MTTFTKNLKKLRLAKKLTQEQAAEKLGVSTQSVSRWECGTTLPDVSILPAIARLYCVSIDDLYKETFVAYDNYAHYLGSVYEASGDPEDFIAADREYRKMLKSDLCSSEDLRSYGVLYQYMAQRSAEKAIEIFDTVLDKGSEDDPETYWRVKRQKGYFLHTIGRNQESIDEFLPAVEAGSEDINQWICLIRSLSFAEKNEDALNWARKAEARFPENASLHIHLGDICQTLKLYDEAFMHWQRARELEPEWMDAAYSMGFCYEELGQYDRAYEMWTEITNLLARRGYDPEQIFPRKHAEACREKMNKKL